MYKKYYKNFLNETKGLLHFAAHSHHFWPDVTLKAQEDYWWTTAKLVDDKWEYFFKTLIPDLRKHIGNQLNLSSTENIVFAPNTHELVFRLISGLKLHTGIQVLTSDSEFYSFDRQINRLQEEHQFNLVKIKQDSNLEKFKKDFLDKLKSQNWDLVVISRVFFNSGLALDLTLILEECAKRNILTIVDDYHGYMALPLDWSKWEHSIFYVAGSYKYAQGGEGACFMIAPENKISRPANTGWYALLETLSSGQNQVSYPVGSGRFLGSTMDYTALYRARAVYDLFEKENITVEKIHLHVQNLQKIFLEKIQKLNFFKEAKLIFHSWENQGHFLTFEFKDEATTLEKKSELRNKNILTDSRSNRLRFGFGLYHDESDIEEFHSRIK